MNTIVNEGQQPDPLKGSKQELKIRPIVDLLNCFQLHVTTEQAKIIIIHACAVPNNYNKMEKKRKN